MDIKSITEGKHWRADDKPKTVKPGRGPSTPHPGQRRGMVGEADSRPTVRYTDNPEPMGRDFFIVTHSDHPDWPVGETFSDDDMSMAQASGKVIFQDADTNESRGEYDYERKLDRDKDRQDGYKFIPLNKRKKPAGKKKFNKDVMRKRGTQVHGNDNQQISESMKDWQEAGIPDVLVKELLRKYNFKNTGSFEQVKRPKASEVKAGDLFASKDGIVFKQSTLGDRYIRIYLPADGGRARSQSYDSMTKAFKGMKGPFQKLDNDYYSWGEPRGYDNERIPSGDPLAGNKPSSGWIDYMNRNYLPRIKPKLEGMIDDIYAGLRKLPKDVDRSGERGTRAHTMGRSYGDNSMRSVALALASSIEDILENGFGKKTTEEFLRSVNKYSTGWGSEYINSKNFHELMKTQQGRIKFAKFFIASAERLHDEVEEMRWRASGNAEAERKLRGESVEEAKGSHPTANRKEVMKKRGTQVHTDNTRKVGRKAKHKKKNLEITESPVAVEKLEDGRFQARNSSGKVRVFKNQAAAERFASRNAAQQDYMDHMDGVRRSTSHLDQSSPNNIHRLAREIGDRRKRSDEQEITEAPMAIDPRNASDLLHGLVDDFINDRHSGEELAELVKALGRDARVENGRLLVQPRGRAQFSIDDSPGREPGHQMKRRSPETELQRRAHEKYPGAGRNWALESARGPLTESVLTEAINLDDLKDKVREAVRRGDAAQAAQLMDEVRDRHRALQQHLSYGVGGESEIPGALNTLKKMFRSLKKVV